jgi:uncharacterized damage-inducible protein DinB
MSSINDAIVQSLTVSQKLLNRYCEDLKPEEYLHRPCAGGNATAWIIGHLILTERSALGRVGVTDLPALPEGFERRFARDEAAPKAGDYGDVSVLLPLFNRHREMLIEAVRKAGPDVLEKPLEKPHPLYGSRVWEAINFMGAHVTMHAGQVTIIRRSMGKPPIV